MLKIDKKNKFIYYVEGYLRPVLPKVKASALISSLKKEMDEETLKKVEERVRYYNQLNEKPKFSEETTIKDLKKPKTPKSYYFDTYEYAQYFDENLSIDYWFGDVTEVPETPKIVKSRPISPNNQNSILLNLDKARHFVFVENDKDFLSKKNILIGRGAVFQQHRYDFFEKYFDHPLCDLGQVNKAGGNPEKWLKPKISLEQHLDYKFILSLQGNDVATNLKWIMSSNSIAVMPKPTLETWFMEGKLEGGKHYIEIRPDYSDVEEQLNYYINNPDKCLEIIQNAHNFVQQFQNKKVEDLCSLLVLQKLF